MQYEKVNLNTIFLNKNIFHMKLYRLYNERFFLCHFTGDTLRLNWSGILFTLQSHAIL